MSNDREYLSKTDTLNKINRLFNNTLNSFQKIIVVYNENDKEKLKQEVDKLFQTCTSPVKSDVFVRNLGKCTNSNQVLMYPLGTNKILKMDFSKGDVRTLHIYDLNEYKTFSLSQSSKNITLASTPFKLIHGINDMDNNWSKLAK